MEIREFGIFHTIDNVTAVDTVSAHERDQVSADKDLARDVKKTGSFLEMLGVSDNKDGILGESGIGFHDNHLQFVKHTLRGAQESWKLGRFTSIDYALHPSLVAFSASFLVATY